MIAKVKDVLISIKKISQILNKLSFLSLFATLGNLMQEFGCKLTLFVYIIFFNI